jgi:hypothetical protein
MVSKLCDDQQESDGEEEDNETAVTIMVPTVFDVVAEEMVTNVDVFAAVAELWVRAMYSALVVDSATTFCKQRTMRLGRL